MTQHATHHAASSCGVGHAALPPGTAPQPTAQQMGCWALESQSQQSRVTLLLTGSSLKTGRARLLLCDLVSLLTSVGTCCAAAAAGWRSSCCCWGQWQEVRCHRCSNGDAVHTQTGRIIAAAAAAAVSVVTLSTVEEANDRLVQKTHARWPLVLATAPLATFSLKLQYKPFNHTNHSCSFMLTQAATRGLP